jgi:hypothetical protein
VNVSGFLGLGFVLIFFMLMLFFTATARKGGKYSLREIPAFAKLRRGIGLAVEAGQRLHISLGHGGVSGLQGASALLGLSMLQRIARAASVSDRPPVATSGEATQAVLSQDTLRSVYHAIGADNQYEAKLGQLTGLTPFSFAAGVLPIVFDWQVSVNILTGHFGSEVALITDAAERTGGLTLAGSDSIPAQAVLYVAAQEPLIGEELYAGGAYIQAGPMHLASVRVQDVLRWVLAAIILAGAALKLVGAL